MRRLSRKFLFFLAVRGGLLLLLVLLVVTNRLVTAGQAEVDQLMKKMENDVLEMAAQVAKIYRDRRCLSETRNQCYSNNYDDCQSRYPNPSCPGGDELNVAACGDGITCAGEFDFTVSGVSLPDSVITDNDGNPTDKQVIETVCWTRLLDEWFLRKHKDDKAFWEGYGVTSPHMYFGALDGTFRILPARHNIHCGYFDPRRRPWYIAASSGPKNIILILDTSHSMGVYSLSLLKKAASTIVQTLTDADRVSIIRFSTDATLISPNSDGLLVDATPENKEKLIESINQFKASGKTNFYEAFDRAFDSFDATIDTHDTDCNSAILFFTDGEMTDTEHNETDILNLIHERKASVEKNIGNPLTIFTYSLGNNAVHTIPKRIACETGGLWSRIDDVRSLPERMTSYYRLFAHGLGDNKNANFTAWVRPYPYASTDIVGTTVSVPVYDRSVQPPLFIGVAGFDFILTAIEKALGVGAGAEEAVNEVVRRSSAICPLVDLTLCERESLRRQAGGEEAMCNDECSATDLSRTEPEECPDSLYFLETLWDNTDHSGKSYEMRVCCPVHDNAQCPMEQISPSLTDSSSSKDEDREGYTKIIIIVACVMGGVIILLILTVVHFWDRITAPSVHVDGEPVATNNEIINTEIFAATELCRGSNEIPQATVEEMVVEEPNNTTEDQAKQ